MALEDWPVAGDEVVRIPIRRRGAERRNPGERFLLRFPRLMRVGGRPAVLLPPRLKLRSRMLAYTIRTVTDGQSRGDFEATYVLYAEQSELHTVPTTGSASLLGFEEVYVGPEGVRHFFEQMAEPWESWHWGREGELIDFGGGAALALFEVVGRGRRSGADVRQEVGLLAEVKKGLLARQKNWLGTDAWGEALQATGLEGLDNPGRIRRRSVVKVR